MTGSRRRPEGRGATERLARGGVLGMAGAVGNGVLAFLLTVVVGRSLGPTGAGVFFAAVALFTIGSNTLELGADTGLVRALSAARATGRVQDLRGTVAVGLAPVLLASTASAVAVARAAPDLARTFLRASSVEDGALALRLLAVALPFGAVSMVCLSGSRGLGSIVPMVVVENLGKPAARLVLAAGVAAGGGSVVWMVGAWALPVAVGALVAAWQLRRGLPRRHGRLTPDAPAPTGRGDLARSFWAFSAPRGLAAMIEVLGTTLGVLLVSALAGSAEAGIYSAAARYVIAGSLALQALRLVIAAELGSALAARDVARATSLHHTATVWVVLSSWPVFLLGAVFPGPLLALFGPGFVAGSAALTLLSSAMLVSLAAGNVQTVQLMGGRSGVNLATVAASLVTNVVLCLVLVPAYGVTGAAAAWATCLVLENVATATHVGRALGVRTLNGRLLEAMAVASACYAVPAVAARTLVGDSLPVLLVSAAASTAVYGAVLLRLQDRFELVALVSSIRARRDT